jgi:hypothetical protein
MSTDPVWHDPRSPWWPGDAPPGLEHDPASDVWARNTGSPERDPDADRATRQAIAAEQRGEYDADGTFRPGTWGPA